MYDEELVRSIKQKIFLCLSPQAFYFYINHFSLNAGGRNLITLGALMIHKGVRNLTSKHSEEDTFKVCLRRQMRATPKYKN